MSEPKAPMLPAGPQRPLEISASRNFTGWLHEQGIGLACTTYRQRSTAANLGRFSRATISRSELHEKS